MSSNYQRFIKLLQKWPVDKSKAGRDFGEHLREQAKKLIAQEGISSTSSTSLSEEISALERISSNVHGNKYPRKLSSTATGLNAEQCKQVLSTEFLEYLNEERSLFKKKK